MTEIKEIGPCRVCGNPCVKGGKFDGHCCASCHAWTQAREAMPPQQRKIREALETIDSALRNAISSLDDQTLNLIIADSERGHIDDMERETIIRKAVAYEIEARADEEKTEVNHD
jgi:hypothetical protein